MKAVILAGAVLAALTGAAAATDYPLTISNGSSADVTAITISGGKVTGFKTVRQGQDRQITVTLADGKCEASVKLMFSDNTETEFGRFDFCSSDTLPIEDAQ